MTFQLSNFLRSSKITRSLLCLTIIFTDLTITLSQDPVGSDAQFNINKLGEFNNQGAIRTFDNRYQGVIGSPYYKDEWSRGDIVTVNGIIKKGIPIKYNMYEDELLAKQNGLEIYVDKPYIKSFTLYDEEDGSSVTFHKLPTTKWKDEFGFFKLIFEGSLKVYEKKGITFTRADYRGGYSANRPYDEFESFSIFYLLRDEKLEKIKGSPAKVSKLFPSKKSEIKKYILTNDIDYKSTDGIKRLFTFYEDIK